jgi:hypothetical protein
MYPQMSNVGFFVNQKITQRISLVCVKSVLIWTEISADPKTDLQESCFVD